MNLAERMKKAIGVKVVGNIDLERVPQTMKPEKATKDEKRALRENQEVATKIHNAEVFIADLRKQYDEDKVCSMAASRKQKELRKKYLEQRALVRAKYADFSLSNTDRQKMLHFNGIRPSAMDVVKVALPPVKDERNEWLYALALVRDENHYYIAIDLYPSEQEDSITTCIDENPDGTFDGIWPMNSVLQKPSSFEERMVRMLVDKYADDIEKAKAYVDGAQERDINEIADLTLEIETLTKQIDEFGEIDKKIHDKEEELDNLRFLLKELNNPQPEYETTAEVSTEQADVASPEQTAIDSAAQENTPLIEFVDNDGPVASMDVYPIKMRDAMARRLSPPDLTATEQKYPHLAFIRMKRELQDMDYPFIDLELKSWLRFRLMGNIARLFDRVGRTKSLTYVLSQEYFDELTHRASTAYRGMTPENVVPNREMARGVIVFPHQGFEDTIIYDINNNGNLAVCLAYIRGGKLMFYESYTTQQIIGEPRIDNFMCKSMKEEGTDINRLFHFIRNLVVSFLAMECDMERTMKHFIEDGQAQEEIREVAEHEPLNYDNDEDVVIRDSNWYSSISVDHLIPVQGYVSHRWVGKGKDKVLQEVWVRPHSRNGYHREAGVTKSTSC